MTASRSPRVRGAERPFHPLGELVEGQPAVHDVLAQHGDRAVPVRVRHTLAEPCRVPGGWTPVLGHGLVRHGDQSACSVRAKDDLAAPGRSGSRRPAPRRAGQSRSSSRGEYAMPWASATGRYTTRPSATLTPSARAGLARTAPFHPWLAMLSV